MVNINKNDVIVIGGNHYNTLWIIRSLGLVGYLPTLILYDKTLTKSFVCKSKYLRESHIVNKKEDITGLLYNLKFKKKIAIIISSDEVVEYVDDNFSRLSEKYYLPHCGAVNGGIKYWMNKERLIDIALKVGLNVAFSKCIKTSNFNDEMLNVPLPCIVRPLISAHGSKSDFKICPTIEDLKASLYDLKDKCSHVLVQEYLEPDLEICSVGVRMNNINYLPGVAHKIKRCRDIDNIGMNMYSYVSGDLNKYVSKRKIDKLLETTNYNGIYSAEFLISKGKSYFLEINFRTDATLYINTNAGINFPEIWCNYLYNNKMDVNLLTYKKKRTYGMTEISYIKYLDWKHPIEAIKDWWRTDCYSIFSWSDMKPFIYKFIYELF